MEWGKCPKCGALYRTKAEHGLSGRTKCNCGAALIDDRPAPAIDPYLDLITNRDNPNWKPAGILA